LRINNKISGYFIEIAEVLIVSYKNSATNEKMNEKSINNYLRKESIEAQGNLRIALFKEVHNSTYTPCGFGCL